MTINGCGKEEIQQQSTPVTVENSETETTEEMQIQEDAVLDTENIAEENTDIEKSENLDEINAKAKRAYGDVLMGYMGYGWERLGVPEIQNGIFQMGNPDSNEVAIVDLDGDGVVELLVMIEDVCMADMREAIFSYDETTGKAVWKDIWLFPEVTFYQNGTLLEESAHPVGVYTIQLYNLYRYDVASENYVSEGTIYEWDKTISAVDEEGKTFPDDIDKDGNGKVYFVPEGENTVTLDDPEYEEWLLHYTGGQELVFDKMALNGTTSEILCEDYEKWFAEATAELESNGNTDLAVEYAKNNVFEHNSTRVLMDNLSSKVTFELLDEGMETYKGYVNGQECMDLMVMDGGDFNYHTAVEGITVMGIKPGDSVLDAIALLEKYGFYEEEENVYVNGVGVDGIGIYLNVDGETVTSVGVSFFSYYFG